MKLLLLTLLTVLTVAAAAQEIKGTLMLKGTVKTKVIVNSVSSVCKLKVMKVKNYLNEDDFGNPAYEAQIQITLDGSDSEKNIKIKLNKELPIVNVHTVQTMRVVKDLDYFNKPEKVTVTIDEKGNLKSTTFPYQSQTITCNF